jgi:hypothetical protein
VLGLVLVGISAPAVQGQQKFRLLDRSATGDVCRTEERFTIDLTLNMAVPDQKVPPMQFASDQHDIYQETVLSTDADGHRQAIRRTYSLAYSRDKTGADETTKTSSLQGKTVTIRSRRGRVSIRSAGGALSAEDRKSLQDELKEHRDFGILPDHALAIGDEWTPKTFLKSFKEATRTEAHARLVEIVPFAGHRCAHIHLTLELDMPSAQGLMMQMKLEGDAYQALDLQRPLSLEMSGPVMADGKVKREGVEMNYSGDGTIHIRIAATWLKVAGKSVTGNAHLTVNRSTR